MKKLSIITINFNNARGLQKTIESVLGQTCCDFEYIIIDGGSTDGSLDIIKKYAHRISYWVSEPDIGIYNAMNKGIQKAAGEFCQFLNSGDILAATDVTEKMLASLEDCSILIGKMLKILPNCKIYRERGLEDCKPTLLTLYRGTLNHSPAYIKRSLFDKYGLYDESMKIVSDWKWFLIVVGLNNEKVVFRDIDVTCFDMSGISNTDKALEKMERRLVLEELIPSNILADYDINWRLIDQATRINRYKITYWVFWFVERILFKLEKWKLLH